MGGPLPDNPGRVPEPPADAAPADPLAEALAKLADAHGEAERAKTQAKALHAQIEELKALAATPPEEPKDLQRLHLLQIQPVRDILVILLVLAVFWLGYILRAVTIPMLLALTLAYLVEPVVSRAVDRGWTSRAGAAVLVMLLSVMLIAVPLVGGVTVGVSQGLTYAQQVRGNVELVQEYLRSPRTPETEARLKQAGRAWFMVGDFLKGVEAGTAPEPEPPAEPVAPGHPGAAPTTPGPPAATGSTNSAPSPAAPATRGGVLPSPEPGPPGTGQTRPGGPLSQQVAGWAQDLLERNMQGIGRVVAKQLLGTGAGAVEVSLRILRAIGYLCFAFFLVMFFFYFFCTGWERVKKSITEMIPKWKKTRTLDMLRQMDEVIAGFVRGRLIIMAIMMGMFTVGYWLIGVPAPLIVGPIVGILSIVPYLGMVSIPISMLLMWVQPVGADWQQTWWWILLAPFGLYFLIQTIDDYVLTTKIQGKTTQMDVPSILFAVLAGGILAGFYGVLLAIPAAACIKILLRESFWPRFQAWAQGRVKDFLPISRYDPTEAKSPGAAGPKPS